MTSVSADTFTVFKPILLFVKCFGLAPFSVSGVLGSRHMRTSVFDVVYAVLVLMVVFSYLVVFHCNLWHTVVGVSICSVNQRVIALSTIFQFMLSAFICLVKRYKIIDIANQLAGLNVSLKRSCGCVWKRICRVLMVHLFISLLSVGSCFLSDMFVHIQDSSTLSFIISNVLNFACFLTEFQIVAFFMLLKQLTSDLNNSIRGLGRINGNKEDPCSCFKKLPLNSTAPIFVTSAYEKLQNNTTDISDSVSRSTKVIFLRDVQDSLCRASEILNSVYSFLLLYTSAKTFICLTHSLYFILLRMFVQDWSTCDKVSPYSYYMWFLHYAIKLVWLVFYSNSTIQQANRTPVVVHKLICKTEDPGLREELRLFSLQLLHRKVKFTACGFFPLDFTFLYSIVGAVTTYLVILVQFRLSLPKGGHNDTATTATPWVVIRPPTDFTITTLPP